MGQKYSHFTAAERDEIARRRQAGESIRKIAAALDRQPSTVSRELRRNSGTQIGYDPAYAGKQSASRRWHGSKLLRQPDLQRRIVKDLAQGRSPEQVAGRLKRESGKAVVSYETIYRFIAGQIIRTGDYKWRHLLPRGKSKRGRRPSRGGSPVDHIKHRIPIASRPSEAATRAVAGHWETDLALFAKPGQAVLALLERSSRIIVLVRQPNKKATSTQAVLDQLLAPLPSSLRRTIAFDNGTEFALHYKLAEKLGIQTFFCDPHAPWQKGGIENAIGRIRKYLPRKTDLQTISQARLTQIARLHNHTPRKCLDFRTPAEVFLQVLHFECESHPG